MKTPDPIAKKELDKIKLALSTNTPTDLEKNCYNTLKTFLNREPTEIEIGNMMTDVNIVHRALNDL